MKTSFLRVTLMLSKKVTVASAFPPVFLCCVMFFVDVSSYPYVSSRRTGKGRIIRLDYLYNHIITKIHLGISENSLAFLDIKLSVGQR